MSRLASRFAALKDQGRAALVTFLTAGDPDPETAQALLDGLPGAGADVIELGMPFSDPMADGPAIQLASQRALAAGQTMDRTLAMVRRFREGDAETPIVLMGYYNPIYRYGVGRFLTDAAAAGVDGLIVVDLPPEEERELALPAKAAGIDFVYLVTPTTGDDRLPLVVRNAGGFVYYVSIAGITGTRSAVVDDVAAAVERIRGHTDLPVAVGFGIKTPAQAREFARIADGAVVGSALVTTLAESLDETGKATAATVETVHAAVRALAEGVRGAAKEGDAA